MSNYVQSLSNYYSNRYSYTSMIGRLNGSNTARNPFVTGSSPYTGNKNYVNTEGVNYLTNIQSSAKNLSSALDDITSSSTFNQVTATSSSKTHLAITDSGKADKTFADTTVSIQSIATGQANKGVELVSAEAYTGGTGTQQFEIEIAGKVSSFSIDVAEGDTNKTVQKKMADAINSAGIGVTAQVILNDTDKTTALRIAADTTGDQDASRFQIRDVGTGNAVASTGAATQVQQAQNAAYTVNGEAKTSLTNKIDLGDGVKATLRKATEAGQDVTVSVASNNDFAVDKVKNIVDSYNELLSAAQTSTNGNARLERQLTDAIYSYASSLEKIGITINDDYSLSLNESALESAAASKEGISSTLEKLFTPYANANFGFANRLSTIAGNVEKNPAYYVTPASNSTSSVSSPGTYSSTADFKREVMSTIEQTTYLSMVNALFSSSTANTSSYNQWYSLGYLFDIWA